MSAYRNDVVFTILVMIGLWAVVLMAVDAQEFQKTGACDGCLLAKGYFEWRAEQ